MTNNEIRKNPCWISGRKLGISAVFFYSRNLVFATSFVICLAIFEYLYLSQRYETLIIGRYLNNGFYLRPIIFLLLTTATLLLTTFFAWSALTSSYKYRPFYFIIFCLTITTEYGYQNVFGRFTNFTDIENAFVNRELNVLANAISDYFSLLSLLPCALFSILLICVKRNAANGLRKLVLIMLAFTGFFSLTSYFTSNTFHSVSISAFYRTIISFPMIWHVGSSSQVPRSLFYYADRRLVLHSSEEQPKNNIVFIVDESIRADHLSINGYSRKTTPSLDELTKKRICKKLGSCRFGYNLQCVFK